MKTLHKPFDDLGFVTNVAAGTYVHDMMCESLQYPDITPKEFGLVTCVRYFEKGNVVIRKVNAHDFYDFLKTLKEIRAKQDAEVATAPEVPKEASHVSVQPKSNDNHSTAAVLGSIVGLVVSVCFLAYLIHLAANWTRKDRFPYWAAILISIPIRIAIYIVMNSI